MASETGAAKPLFGIQSRPVPAEADTIDLAIDVTEVGTRWRCGFRKGAGTTNQLQIYRFTDTDIPFKAERVRYRLRQKDFGGTRNLSKEVTAQLGAQSKTKLHAPFPNPASQQATLRYEVPDGLQGWAQACH